MKTTEVRGLTAVTCNQHAATEQPQIDKSRKD